MFCDLLIKRVIEVSVGCLRRHSDPATLANLTVDQMYEAMTCKQIGDLKPCQSNIGIPVMIDVVFGGLSCAGTSSYVCPGDPCNHTAEALILTYLLNDTPNITVGAAKWETEVFLALVENFSHPVLQATYMAQVCCRARCCGLPCRLPVR